MIFFSIRTKKVKRSLVFFCALWCVSCGKSGEVTSYNLRFIDGKATAVVFNIDQSPAPYAVFIKGNTQTPVLGSFREEKGQQLFEPAIAFASGQAYQLKKGGKTVLEFVVPKAVSAPPRVVAVYPSGDTIPENLLKMYFEFSQPMQEVGNMLEYIKVYNKTDGREEDIFLSLENELWDAAHTRLTLWLDPGRIKQDLIPNKEKGLPLIEGKEYELTITTDLKNAQGVPLAETLTKRLYVKARDSKRISIKDWIITTPKAYTKNALHIHFKEPLDAILARDALTVYNAQGALVAGAWELTHNEQQALFIPEAQWQKGNYPIEVDALLEDLAGNKRHRLFDSNLEMAPQEEDTHDVHQLVFMVE